MRGAIHRHFSKFTAKPAAFLQTKPLSRAGSDPVGPYTFDRLGLSNASESGGQSLSRAMRVYSAYSAYLLTY